MGGLQFATRGLTARIDAWRRAHCSLDLHGTLQVDYVRGMEKARELIILAEHCYARARVTVN